MWMAGHLTTFMFFRVSKTLPWNICTVELSKKSVFINGRYRNIPDAIEYVDLDKFGNKLLDEFGDDSFQLLPNGKVVAIGCGW